jgi:hypothetical protein
MDRLETRSLQTWLAEFKAARAEVRILCSLHFA